MSAPVPPSVPLAASLVAAAILPARLAVAFTRTTLALGRLSSEEGPVLGRGGYAERLAALRDLTAPDRPLGRALAEGGPVDRVLAPEGPVERLLVRGGAGAAGCPCSPRPG